MLVGNDFSFTSLDAEGGAIKWVNAVDTMRRPSYGLNFDRPETEGVPQLRTMGLALLQDGRADAVVAALQQAMSQNAAAAQGAPGDGTLELFAEDLVRGWAVDICDVEAGIWSSLSGRRGTYRIIPPGATAPAVGRPFLQANDEGWISAHLTEEAPQPGAGEPPLRLGEAVFRWDGWGLAAPRPGRSIAPDDHAPPRDRDNSLGATTGLVAEFSAIPGSLPALRFGRKYTAILRAIDLAGNAGAPLVRGGDPDQAKKAGVALDPFAHLRFDPVPPPLVVSLIAPKPGESLDRIVLRSDVLTPPAPAEIVERHLTPPPGGTALAELHGRLDRSGTRAPMPDPTKYDLIAKHAGSFSGTDPTKPPPQPGRGRDGSLVIPFLPDPLARGMMLRLQISQFDAPAAADLAKGQFLAGMAPPLQADLPHPDWPQTGTWRLVLAEMTDPPRPTAQAEREVRMHADATSRTITVKLRKAERAKLLISSTLAAVPMGSFTDADRKVLDLLGLWDWYLTTPPVPMRDQWLWMAEKVLSGLCWPYTPYRVVELVHAVRHPLRVTSLAGFATMSKAAEGQTSAGFAGTMMVDGLSTLKVDIEAVWSEMRDDPAAGAPREVNVKAHAAEIDLRPGQLKIDFGPAAQGIDMSHARHEFHDTRYRLVSYEAKATTRFREYFIGSPPSSVTTNPVTKIVVPSSRRPDPPAIAYVIPTFGWDATAVGPEMNATATVVSERHGGGLRVWLERPWFSSGDGERLAVVFASDGADFRSLTALARDPLWRTQEVEFPTLAANDLGTAVGPVWLPDLGPDAGGMSHVFLAPFDVAWSPDRGMWFVDLTVKLPAETYAPLIRLALARYQPNSTEGCHLSKVAFADFAPLLPGRRTTLTIDRLQRRLKILVEGTIPQLRAPSPWRASISAVALNQRRRLGDTELAWATDEELLTELIAAAGGNAGAPSSWYGELAWPSISHTIEQRIVVLERETYFDAYQGPQRVRTTFLEAFHLPL